MADMVRLAGLDVSKDKLDVYVTPSGESRTVGYDRRGLAGLRRWLVGLGVALVAVEASGGYEREVSEVLKGGPSARTTAAATVRTAVRRSIVGMPPLPSSGTGAPTYRAGAVAAPGPAGAAASAAWSVRSRRSGVSESGRLDGPEVGASPGSSSGTTVNQ